MSSCVAVGLLVLELAHDHYGDALCTRPVGCRAWRWAARLLIPDEDYADAEAEHQSAGAIAEHLGVTVEIVHAWACQMVCVSRTERNGKNHDHDEREAAAGR